MSYKPDKQRVEDAIIPALLEELMNSHIEQMPDKDPKVYDKALGLLMPDILTELTGDAKLCKRLNRLKKVVIDYMAAQRWSIPKAYMVISALADILHQNNSVEFGEGTKEVVSDISEIILENYNDEEIKSRDESALKQAPKLLKVFQKEGYF